MDVEKYDRTGLRDAYRVFKALEEPKLKPIERKEGGKPMEDETKYVDQPTPTAEATQTVVPKDQASPVVNDPDLFEPEEGDE